MGAINAVKDWLVSKKFFLSNRCKLICWSDGGKKYLAVLYTGWRGYKINRKFEVVTELDDDMEPIDGDWPEAIRT